MDVGTARWLVSDVGLSVVAEVTSRLDAGEDVHVVSPGLRRAGLDVARSSAAVAAAIARRSARDLWAHGDRLLFTRESLEQASHPAVSAHRALRFEGQQVHDLCAGVGGDAMALARVARQVVAVEHDAARAVLLEHNTRIAGATIDVLHADALEVTVPATAAVHADPARRLDGKRLRRLAEHLPSIPALLARHGGSSGVGIVVAAGLDLADPDLPTGCEIEFVQFGSRLVEAMLWLGAARRGSATATATLLPHGEQRSRAGARPEQLEIGRIGDHLVEVAPAAVRARLHDDIGREMEARRLARHRALLTVDGDPPDSPWYEARPIVTVLPARARAIRAWLRSHDPAPVEVVLHGVEGDPQRWWQEIGRPPRGPSGLRIELVRFDQGAKALVTRAAGDQRAG